MTDTKGIGYVVACPDRGTFLGRLGEWYTDVRLAQVYSEPRTAKSALKRAAVTFDCVVVPATVTVAGKDIDNALSDIRVVPTEATEPEPEQPAEAMPKRRIRATAPTE